MKENLEPGLLIPVNYSRTIDGDTIEVEIRRKFNVRLRDIDCPEKDTKEGIEASEYVETLMGFADNILVFIPTNCPDKLMDFNSFERVVGDIYIKDNNLSTMLKAKGYEKK